MPNCWKCGTFVQADEKYCNRCGAVQNPGGPPPESSNIGIGKGQDRTAFFLIAILVFIFIILPTLAFIGFAFMFHNEIDHMNPSSTTPSVTTSFSRVDSYTVRCEFTSCSPSFQVSLSCMADLSVNGDQADDPFQQFLGNSASFVIDGTTFTVGFVDVNGDGMAEAGDGLNIVSSSPTGPASFDLCLLYLPTGYSIFCANAVV